MRREKKDYIIKQVGVRGISQ